MRKIGMGAKSPAEETPEITALREQLEMAEVRATETEAGLDTSEKKVKEQAATIKALEKKVAALEKAEKPAEPPKAEK